MRRFGIAMVMVGLLSIGILNIMKASDKKPAISYFTVFPGAQGFSDLTQSYFDEIISAINDNLSDYGIELRLKERDASVPLLLDIAFDVDINRKKTSQIEWGLTTTLYNSEWMGIPNTSMPSLEHLNAISPLLIQDHNPIFVYDTYFVQAFDDQVTKQVLVDYISGLTLYANGDCLQSLPYFVRAENANNLTLEYTNLISAASFYKGNCSLISGDLEAAAQFYEYGLENPSRLIDPSNPFQDNFALQANLAWVYLTQGERNDALNLLDQMLDNANSFKDLNVKTDSYFIRTQLLATFGEYSTAIDSASKTIELVTPDNFDTRVLTYLYLLRGKMYLAQYEWDSALADYNKAIELDPTDADAYYERGVLYYSILQTGVELRSEAFSDFHHYLEIDPNGDHAADALRYAAQIEKELEALNG